MIILCHRCENTSIVCAKVEIVFQPPKKLEGFAVQAAPLFIPLSLTEVCLVTKKGKNCPFHRHFLMLVMIILLCSFSLEQIRIFRYPPKRLGQNEYGRQSRQQSS